MDIWMCADPERLGCYSPKNGRLALPAATKDERRAAWDACMAESARATAQYAEHKAKYRAQYGEPLPEPILSKPKRATKRLSIRPHTYRGKAGYLVSGGGGIYGTSVHCVKRETAETVKAAAKRDDWDGVDAALRAEDTTTTVKAPRADTGKPTCPRCGRKFRKSGVGLAWHIANNTNCAA